MVVRGDRNLVGVRMVCGKSQSILTRVYLAEGGGPEIGILCDMMGRVEDEGNESNVPLV